MKRIASIVLLIALVALAAVLGCADFYVWRLKHPTAPAWTYAF